MYLMNALLVAAVSMVSVAQVCKEVRINRRHIGKRLMNHVIYSFYAGLPICVSECWMVNHCLSLNYDQDRKICELNSADESTASSTDFRTNHTFFYTDISVWTQSPVGACVNKPCTGKQMCEPGYSCVDMKCPDPPLVTYAALDITGPSVFYLGDTASYTCLDTAVLEGDPTIKCARHFKWTTPTFTCKEIIVIIRGNCEVGWSSASEIPNNCYKAVFEDRTFTGAVDLCKSMDATVLQINSTEVFDFIVAFGKEQEQAHPDVIGYWLGLVGSSNSSYNEWVYYGTETDFTYWRWSQSRWSIKPITPLNYPGTSPYVSKKDDYFWDAALQNSTLFVICEKSA